MKAATLYRMSLPALAATTIFCTGLVAGPEQNSVTAPTACEQERAEVLERTVQVLVPPATP
jgi:hypothetical protein